MCSHSCHIDSTTSGGKDFCTKIYPKEFTSDVAIGGVNVKFLRAKLWNNKLNEKPEIQETKYNHDRQSGVLKKEKKRTILASSGIKRKISTRE